MKKIIYDALKLLVLFGSLWIGFSYLPIFSNSKDSLTVSVATEEKIGTLLVADELANEKEIKNPVLDTAISIIGNRLISNIGLTDYNYHFRVIDNSQINAFTLPGGNIFIYSGLIKYTKSPDELAAVLAHEIGHVEKRHVIKKLEKEFDLTVLFSILTGNNKTVLTQIGRTATSAVFDRKQESDADEFAFHLLDKSGINPLAFATLFQRITAEQGTNHLDFAILRTHPDNNSRIKAAMEYKKSTNFKEKPFDIDWKKVKASLNDSI